MWAALLAGVASAQNNSCAATTAVCTIASKVPLPAHGAPQAAWPSAADLAAFDRAADFETVHDWVLKFEATDDPELVHHVLHEVTRSASCVGDLMTMAEYQTRRCPQLLYKIGVQRLQRVGLQVEAERMVEDARQLRHGGRQWIFWEDAWQTPSVYVQNLSTEPSGWYDCAQFPIAQKLREQYESIRAEAEGLTMNPSYPFLSPTGTWENYFVYTNRTWNPDSCSDVPELCKAFKPLFPTRSDIAYTVPNNEMLMLFRLEVGSWVPPHSGASNTQINVHLSLTGRNTTLKVKHTSRTLGAGDLACFDDSFVHEVYNGGDETRIAVVARVMHPGMTVEQDFAGRTIPAHGPAPAPGDEPRAAEL